MRGHHDVVPGLRRQRAAGHAVGRRVVVIAVPDRAGEVAGVADEPGVAVVVGGAGLAGRRNAVQRGPPRGAFADDMAHHPRHVGGDRGGDGLHRLRAVAVEAPDQIAGAGADFQHGMRRHRPCPCSGTLHRRRRARAR